VFVCIRGLADGRHARATAAAAAAGVTALIWTNADSGTYARLLGALVVLDLLLVALQPLLARLTPPGARTGT
jgi:hypothetical protein